MKAKGERNEGKKGKGRGISISISSFLNAD